jgi:hypothetical protein
VTSIERADTYSDRYVVRCLTRFQLQFLGSDLTKAHASGCDLNARRRFRLRDRPGRSVYSENVSIADPLGDFSCGSPWTTPYLQHTYARPEGQRIHYGRKSSGQRSRHQLSLAFRCPWSASEGREWNLVLLPRRSGVDASRILERSPRLTTTGAKPPWKL